MRAGAVAQRRLQPSRYDRTGNVLLDRIFGAGLNFVPRDIDWTTELEKVAEVVRRRGGKPFIIPIGGSTPTGALGYVGCAQEILQQARLRPLSSMPWSLLRQRRHAIGLLVGLRGSGIPVIGISCAGSKERSRASSSISPTAPPPSSAIPPISPEASRGRR